MNIDSELGNDSIKVFRGLEGIRRRPKMYVCDIGNEEALYHLLSESWCHALDEAIDQNCSFLGINFSGNSAEINYDAGISLEINRLDKKTRAESMISELFACRHDKKHREIGERHCSVGIVALNALSSVFQLETACGDFRGVQTYRKGNPTTAFKLEASNGPDFTHISFRLDPQILGDHTFQLTRVEQLTSALRAEFPNLEIVVNEVAHINLA